MTENFHILIDIDEGCGLVLALLHIFLTLDLQVEPPSQPHTEGKEQWQSHTMTLKPRLLTFHWPKQVTWTRLMPLGWGHTLFPQKRQMWQ